MIGVAVGVRTTSEAEAALRQVASSADIAEIRLDFMAECDLPRLLHDRPCPVILTNRPDREGGHYRGSEAARVRLLHEAIDLGVEYVDIEHDATDLIRDRKDTKLVISRHDFRGVPQDILGIHRDLADKGADVVKIVGMAQRIKDNVGVLEALEVSELPMISIAMGEAGLVSRILALRYDSCFLTYGVLDTSEEVAPGQLAIKTMRDVYSADEIGSETVVYGLIGLKRHCDALLSTVSAATHRAGVDAVWMPFIVSEAAGDDPAEIVRAFRRERIAGYVVLGPSQLMVGTALDDILSSRQDGAINVIRVLNGRMVGEWSASLPEAFALITGRESPIVSNEIVESFSRD